MKKIILILLCILFITGCVDKGLIKYYQNTTIGDAVESYQMDLRISGMVDEGKIKKIYKIDNYKNTQYTIINDDYTYYVIEDIVYIEKIEDKRIIYEKNESDIFYKTDIILDGMNYISYKKQIENDIVGLDLVAYEVKIKHSYIKMMLNVLGYSDKFKKASGKVYIKDNQIYKIIYNIDEMIINSTIYRINSINEKKINLNINKEA